MPGLDPGIHVLAVVTARKAWMAGSGPAMTKSAAQVHEKNAIFSAWLMRRIAASGSDAEVAGLRTMPLAIRLEPRERSVEG